MSAERMPPLPEAALTPEQAQARAAIINGPRGVFEGPFIALLRSPELMGRLEKVGEYLRFGGALPARIREFAILIIARAYDQQTEWGIHQPIALKCGLAAAAIEAIAAGSRPSPLPADEQAVWDFLLELERHRKVSDAAYAAVTQHFGEAGVVDLTAIAGYYALLAQILNVARTPPPPGAPRLPVE
jgi:4-carboxymuconolactone decarboxylase